MITHSLRKYIFTSLCFENGEINLKAITQQPDRVENVLPVASKCGMNVSSDFHVVLACDPSRKTFTHVQLTNGYTHDSNSMLLSESTYWI